MKISYCWKITEKENFDMYYYTIVKDFEVKNIFIVKLSFRPDEQGQDLFY